MMGVQGPWTVAELCAMGYGVETSYGYNLTGNFTEAGVPVPSDLAARLAGEDGKLLKVTNLKADAAVCTLMFPSGDSLTDARLQNLNHGDWWLDGTTGTGGVSHGNLAGLDAASVEYLMTNLWDLTTDKVGKNWRTTDNSWKMWTYEHTQELTDARAVVNFSIAPTGANANSWLRTQSALNGFKFRVTGLAEGDRLEFGAGVVAPTEASIYEDGEYVISKPNVGLKGFKLYNDTETGTRVLTLEIVAPYDAGNHLVSSAALHVPEAWRGKLTDAMLNAAAKGWSVWIGDEELKGTPDAVGVLLKDGTRVGYSAVPASGYTADEVEGVYVDDGTMAVVLALTDICDENPAGYGVYFCDGGQHCDELEGTTGVGAASSDRDGVGNTAKLAASLASNQAWAVHRAKAAFDGRGYLMALGEFCWLKDHYTDILQDLFPKCGGTALKAGSASTGDSKDSYWTSTLNQKTDDGLLYFCWISSFAPYDDGANVQTRMYVRAARPLEEGE